MNSSKWNRCSSRVFPEMLLSLCLFIALLLSASMGCNQPAAEPSIQGKTSSPSLTADPSGELKTQVNRVDLVMFHPRVRCASCISIEQRTRALLDNSFKGHLASGKLNFQSYDLQDQKNTQMVQKYGPVGSQLFITIIKDGVEQTRHVEEVWMPQLLNNGPKFDEFLHELVSKSLKEVS